MTDQEDSIAALLAAYDRFLPREFFALLGKADATEVRLGDQVERTMTMLFSDIREFTALSEAMTPQQNFDFINSYLGQMEPVIREYGGLIDKYVGDGIMALYPNSADKAVQGSIAMLDRLAHYNAGRKKAGYQPIRIGIGLNTGLAMLGTVGGERRMEGTVISDAVNLASRIEGMTKRYGVGLLISEHTFYRLGNSGDYCIRFLDRVRVKGKSQPQSVYEVFDNDPLKLRQAKLRNVRNFEEALACYHFKKIERAAELLQRCLADNPDDSPARVYLERCETFLAGGGHETTGEIDTEIVWHPEMQVGVAVIDRQHQELFKGANALMHAFRQGGEQSEVERLIAFLDQYVVDHFREEEAIMERHGYPFLAEQKEQHAKFIRYFNGLKKELVEVSGSRTYLMFRIQLLVADWLVTHTQKADGHFGRFLRRQE